MQCEQKQRITHSQRKRVLPIQHGCLHFGHTIWQIQSEGDIKLCFVNNVIKR